MRTIDTLVATAVFRARLIERALHDAGPWSIGYADQVLPAERIIEDDRIVFRAVLPRQCWVVPPDSRLVLRSGEDVVAVREIEHLGDGGFVLDWVLSVEERIAA